MAYKQFTLILIIVVLCINCTLSDTKLWTVHHEKSSNFENDDPECINQTFIFKQKIGIYFQIPEQINTIILPSTGSIIFPENQQILFIPRQSKCHSENYNTKHFRLQLNHPMSWFDPANWQNEQQPNNKAIPLIDRIPCECDIVEFTANHSLYIDLHYVPELTVKQVKINGKIDNFNEFLETNVGQSMFMSEETLSFKEGLCEKPKSCGCHAPVHFEEYFNLVCLNADVCREPNCINPIQPMGFCCPICGAMIQITVNESYCQADMDNFNKELQLAMLHINYGKYVNLVDGYVGMFRGEHDNDVKVQVTCVDSGEYNELSVELMKLLTNTDDVALTLDHYQHNVAYSGRAYNPNRTFSVWLIVFGSLLLVVTMYGTIYLYYNDDSRIRKYNPFNRFRLFTSPFVFARFENRDGDTARIAVSVEFDENPNSSISINERIASAFDNPMFNSRNKEHKIDTIGPNALNMCVDDHDGESITSVKLVEVELDSKEET